MMAKSEKSKVAKRVEEVLKLLTVGANASEIRRYADQHGWELSARQVQRYIQRAHKQFARLTLKNRRQLLGIHLAKRNALYTKAVKDGDLKTALAVLRDEAKLEGLYPGPPKPETEEERLKRFLGPDVKTDLSRATRVARLLAAQAKGDDDGEKLVMQSSPKLFYALPDTSMPIQMLHILALIYVTEQLEHAGMVANALYMATREEPDTELCAKAIFASAYRFKVGREGWELFCQHVQVDPDHLVSENYTGVLLEMIGDNVVNLALTEEQVKRFMFEENETDKSVVTAAGLAKSWRRLFEKVVRE